MQAWSQSLESTQYIYNKRFYDQAYIERLIPQEDFIVQRFLLHSSGEYKGVHRYVQFGVSPEVPVVDVEIYIYIYIYFFFSALTNISFTVYLVHLISFILKRLFILVSYKV